MPTGVRILRLQLLHSGRPGGLCSAVSRLRDDLLGMYSAAIARIALGRTGVSAVRAGMRGVRGRVREVRPAVLPRMCAGVSTLRRPVRLDGRLTLCVGGERTDPDAATDRREHARAMTTFSVPTIRCRPTR